MDPAVLDALREHWRALLALLAGLVLVYLLLQALLARAFRAARARRRPEDGAAEASRAYLSDLERWLSLALAVLFVLGGLVAVLWVLGYQAMVSPILAQAQVKGLRIAIIIFLAFLAQRTLRFVVGQFMAQVLEGKEWKRDQEARHRTISDVLMRGGTTVIAVVAAFLVLETLLESVGTVLASVGFLSVALGFGAQSLVRDVISGFFILLENQIAIGDAVRINDLWGTVERIGLRSTTIRDGEGVAHIIPNGSITRISNATKGWSRAVVFVGTDYGVDPDKALGVLAQVAREIREDPLLAGVFLQEPEVSGPEAFDDAVQYRIAAATEPTRQWEAMRRMRHAVWKAFAREGIPLRKSPGHSAAGKVE